MVDTLAMWNSPIPWVILVIVLLLFGGNKIPEMMGGLAKGLKSFKNEMDGNEDDELRREREKEAQIRARVEEEMRREKEISTDREKLAKQ